MVLAQFSPGPLLHLLSRSPCSCCSLLEGGSRVAAAAVSAVSGRLSVRRPPHQQQGLTTSARTHQEEVPYLMRQLQRESSPEYVSQLVAGVTSGDRLSLSRALTLCESSRPEHKVCVTVCVVCV